MSYAPFKFFKKNPVGRDFVVGDIHGFFSSLEMLLLRLNFDPRRDRVFAVGDLIDRGPESHRLIEFMNYPWFHSIMGNHEKMLLDAADNSSVRDNWMVYNGGNWWQQIPEHLQGRLRQQVADLPLAFEVATAVGRVGIVHADIPTGMPWSLFIQKLSTDQGIAEYALWSRHRYKYWQNSRRSVPVENIDLVVFGHTPTPKPLHISNLYYIDTGAAYADEGLGNITLLQIHPCVEVHQIRTPKHIP